MATSAVMACKLAKDFYLAKFVHYGMDSYDEIKSADFDEFKESMLLGDSTSAFEGSYLDYDYCIHQLNWTEESFFKNLRKHAAKCFKSLDEVLSYAKDECVDIVFICDSNNKIAEGDKVVEGDKIVEYGWNDCLCTFVETEDDDDEEEEDDE